MFISRVCATAAPNLPIDTGGVGSQVEAGDNGELISATAKGEPEVGIRRPIGICDRAVGENDLFRACLVSHTSPAKVITHLEIVYVVGSKTVL